MNRRTNRFIIGTAAATGLALVAGSALAIAQDASSSPAPLVESQPTSASPAFPLHIHSGTCDRLGDVVFPLGTISKDLMINGEPVLDANSEENAQDVAVNLTLVDATLDDITAAPHAINIHASEDDMGTRIACGDLSGPVFDDTLVIRLNPGETSDYLGVALLKTDQDGNTAVYTMVTEQDTTMGSVLPETTEPSALPSEEPAMSEEPVMSEVPAMSEEPGMSEEPAASESPEMSEAPEMSEEPMMSDEPTMSEAPQMSEVPEESPAS